MNHNLLPTSKTIAFLAVATLPLALAWHPLSANPPLLSVEGDDIQPVEVGVWEGVVDLQRDEIRLKQLQGDKEIKIAAVLGNSSNVTTTGVAKLYNNFPLIPNGGNNFASLSLRFQITNNTGATLGQATAGNPTGIRLQLMPYAGTTAAADGTKCETGATTLQQPICVVTTTIPAGQTGASGRNNGSDPVYLAYMTPRDGTNLTVGDDTSATEWNEATGRTSGTDFARAVWLTNTTIPHDGRTTIGLRFRYQQTAAGNGQPRVTKFRYKFRLLADRIGGAAPTAGKAYVTTVAGDGSFSSQNGVGAQARFDVPTGVAVNPSGTKVYVADYFNHRIRAIDLSTNRVSTLAGSDTAGFQDGNGAEAQFNRPISVAVNPSGTILYVADQSNHRIRAIDLSTTDYKVSTLAGTDTAGFNDGDGATAQFSYPSGVAVNPSGTKVYVGDRNNYRIRAIDLSTNRVSTLAGSGRAGFNDGDGATAQFDFPTGVAVNPSGTKVYVADRLNHRIRAIDLSTNRVSTLAGSDTIGFQDGNGAKAQFNFPTGVAVNPSGKILYVADFNNHRIRAIDLSTTDYKVSTLAGDGTAGFQDGNGATAQFNNPFGVGVNPSGTKVYVADELNQRIRQIQAIEGVAP